jgi:ubiquinone/menaquinone biosynthesis C-methylase UbiE
MNGLDGTAIVRAGYDAMGDAYLRWRAHDDPGWRFLDRMDAELAARSLVLDLGCGPGVPAAALAPRHRVAGVDISSAQLRIARRTAPAAMLVQGNAARLPFADRSFDAAIALYALIHIPRALHADALGELARVLRPDAPVVLTMSAADEPFEGVEDDWLGVPMYWSGFDAVTNRRLVASSGFDIEADEIATEIEDDEEVRFLWIVARRSSVEGS